MHARERGQIDRGRRPLQCARPATRSGAQPRCRERPSRGRFLDAKRKTRTKGQSLVGRQYPRLLPKITVADRVEHFDETIARSDFLSEVTGRAGPAEIAPAKEDRIDTRGVGKPRHLAFNRVGHLVGAKAAKGAADAVVGVSEPPAVADIGARRHVRDRFPGRLD